MANPGQYPPMGQMQPMGGPHLGPPMGMRPQVRQGTSHIVPVVVSAGLAVGVFCGLLFGLGVKKAVEPAKGTNGAKQSEESQVQTAPVSTGSGGAAGMTPKPPPATGSAAPAAGGAVASTGGAGSAAAPAAAAPKPGKLTFDIKPDAAAQIAKITVDGKPAAGLATDIAFDPGTKEKTVKVVVQAPGYQDDQRDQPVKSDETVSLSVTMKPVHPAASSSGGGDDKGGASSGGTKATGTGNKGNGKGSGSKGKDKGSGLIDI